MPRSPFEPLSTVHPTGWRARWNQNQGNLLLIFTGLLAVLGSLAMAIIADRPTREVAGPSVEWMVFSEPQNDALPDQSATEPFPQNPEFPGPNPDRDAEGTDARDLVPLTQADGETGSRVAGSTEEFMVAVSGASNQRGQIRIAIYADEDTFNQPEKAIFRESVPIENGSGYCPVPRRSLPARIAVAAFHDENDNGELDRDLLNRPTEAYGYTNRARGMIGPPPFSAAVLDTPPAGMELRMVIRQ